MTPALADRGSNVCHLSIFMLIPTNHAHVHRVTVTDAEFEPGRLATGVIYSFLANLTDVATIPHLDWTGIRVREPATVSEPWIWRSDAADPSICVSVEEESDSLGSSLVSEAKKAWQSMSEEINRRCRWMSLIGLHRQIIARVREPLNLRHVEIRTVHDDMLARMFATGSAEIARVAGILHRIEENQRDREPEYRTTLKKFLWGQTDEVPMWAQTRYDAALAGGYHVLQSRFAPPEEIIHE